MKLTCREDERRRKIYHEGGLISEMAERAGVEKSTFAKWMRRVGLEARGRKSCRRDPLPDHVKAFLLGLIRVADTYQKTTGKNMNSAEIGRFIGIWMRGGVKIRR